MTESIAELKDFAEGTDVKVRGIVKLCFQHRSGNTKDGRYWWRQDLVLQGEVGDEVKVSWWNPWTAADESEVRDLRELKDQSVIVVGKTDHYFSKKDSAHMIGIKCSGPDGIQGATLRNASSASAPAASTATPPPASPRPGTITDFQWVEWAEEMAEEVARMPWLARMSGDHAGAVQAALATMWVAAEKGNLRLTKGPFGKAEKPQAEEEPQGVVADPGDDIPFALFLAPLLGAVLAALGVG